MLVRTLKGHSNGFGDAYGKVAGDVYDHPSPKALIERGKLEAVDKPAPKVRKRTRRKKA